jgi:hypothetical protein
MILWLSPYKLKQAIEEKFRDDSIGRFPKEVAFFSELLDATRPDWLETEACAGSGRKPNLQGALCTTSSVDVAHMLSSSTSTSLYR